MENGLNGSFFRRLYYILSKSSDSQIIRKRKAKR